MKVWRNNSLILVIALPCFKISQHFIFNNNNYEEEDWPANLKVSHDGKTFNVYGKKNQQIATLLQSAWLIVPMNTWDI